MIDHGASPGSEPGRTLLFVSSFSINLGLVGDQRLTTATSLIVISYLLLLILPPP